jgi:hypothetical protein
MATVACPGCGLPRVEGELTTKPCPVCDAAPSPVAPRAKTPAAPDPTATLPADVSQLHAQPPRADGGSRAAVGAVAFALGLLCGVGGVFAVQSLDGPRREEPTEVAAVAPPTPADTPAPPRPAPAAVPVAPMPREVVPPMPEPEPGAEPDPKQPPPPAGRVTTFELNQPDRPFALPFPMKSGEHVVLKGKAKSLRVSNLDGGAVLDASGLEVESASLGGKIDGGAKLKLKAAAVTVMSRITGGAEVAIDAPGGEVKFTAAARDGTKIDGGAQVSVTARVVEFKGDIAGDGTRVSVTLTRSAWLKFASLSGRATLEYRSQLAGWSPPDVIPGAVAPGATFRKIDGDR